MKRNIKEFLFKDKLKGGTIFYGLSEYDREATPDPSKKGLINLKWIIYLKHWDQFKCEICKIKEKVVTYNDNFRWQARNFMINHKRCKRK